MVLPKLKRLTKMPLFTLGLQQTKNKEKCLKKPSNIIYKRGEGVLARSVFRFPGKNVEPLWSTA